MIGFRLFRSQMPSLLLYALFPRVKQKELTSFTINHLMLQMKMRYRIFWSVRHLFQSFLLNF